jgi:hypothetical protein
MSIEKSSREKVRYTKQNNIKTELRETGSEDVTQAAGVHVK